MLGATQSRVAEGDKSPRRHIGPSIIKSPAGAYLLRLGAFIFTGETPGIEGWGKGFAGSFHLSDTPQECAIFRVAFLRALTVLGANVHVIHRSTSRNFFDLGTVMVKQNVSDLVCCLCAPKSPHKANIQSRRKLLWC
jgi:hypothetical protein